jgi:hypothetical protein
MLEIVSGAVAREHYEGEGEWHRRMRELLNAQVSDPNFFVWLNVSPAGGRDRFPNQDTDFQAAANEIASATREWLGSLDADQVIEARTPPRTDLDAAGVVVSLWAIPKKAGHRMFSGVLVANPEPAIAYWI